MLRIFGIVTLLILLVICLAKPLEEGDNIKPQGNAKGILAEGSITVEREEAEGKTQEKQVGHVIEKKREESLDEGKKDTGGKESPNKDVETESPKNQPIVVHDMSNDADEAIQTISTLQILFLLAFAAAIELM